MDTAISNLDAEGRPIEMEEGLKDNEKGILDEKSTELIVVIMLALSVCIRPYLLVTIHVEPRLILDAARSFPFSARRNNHYHRPSPNL